MPVVDLKSGSIVGTKKGSLTYYHEKGHIEFSKTSKGITLDYCKDSYLIFTICLLTINQFLDWLFIKILTGALVLAVIGIYVYEELWCWNYALKIKKNKVKKWHR